MAKLRRPVYIINVGVDPNSTKMAVVAFVTGLEEPLVRQYVLDEKQGPRACRNAYRAAHALMDELWKAHPEPLKARVRVCIEAAIIFGNRGRAAGAIPQSQAVGAFVAGLTERKARVGFVASASWKKSVLGNGRLDKRGVASAVRQRWPEHWELVGGSQDTIDAYCIARHAHHLGASRV